MEEFLFEAFLQCDHTVFHCTLFFMPMYNISFKWFNSALFKDHANFSPCFILENILDCASTCLFL